MTLLRRSFFDLIFDEYTIPEYTGIKHFYV